MSVRRTAAEEASTGGRGRGSSPRVLRLALAYLSWCECWRRELGWRPGLADQIERAAASTLANLGEAFDSDTLPEKRRYFRYALASTGESSRLLTGVRRLDSLPPPALQEGLRLLRDIKWDLLRLIRWTRR